MRICVFSARSRALPELRNGSSGLFRLPLFRYMAENSIVHCSSHSNSLLTRCREIEKYITLHDSFFSLDISFYAICFFTSLFDLWHFHLIYSQLIYVKLYMCARCTTLWFLTKLPNFIDTSDTFNSSTNRKSIICFLIFKNVKFI